MAINVTINISENGSTIGPSGPSQCAPVIRPEEPLPRGGIDAFLSHFVISLRLSGKPALINLTLPCAVQTVSRSNPFVYAGCNQAVDVPIPPTCTLPSRIAETDFRVRPTGFFTVGHENIWVQILNLDARANTDIGPVRIILGETLKREYPDLFLPSLGVVESLERSGFPARLFFSPVAVLETSVGKYRTTPKALVAANITSLPPLGAPLEIQSPVPLQSIDELRAGARSGAVATTTSAEIVALSHPIDANLLVSPAEAFAAVESGASAR